MRYKVIWATAGMILLWMAIMGGTILLDFDRVQRSNQATTELEWTFICDEMIGEYAEIDAIEGGKNFIGRPYNGVDDTLIDEKGRALSDTYDSLESIGEGYVRYEVTMPGVAIEGRENLRIGVLNDQGEELPEEEAMELLYEKDAEKDAEKETAGPDTEESDGNNGTSGSADARQAAGYYVAKGDRKYVGIKDRAGNWIAPPAFDQIEITADQKYAVIKNGSNIGIAVLEK